ncbi:MAG: hypothetical protein CFH34_01314 [Alphaproteobacteria bacterium MarineAlpha9_Bin4]|nr:hypothetical protein [Pelagibacterales bacterium]PPR25714.1 MAG: hypothetical protein CFH34_01314 [Alphaproteobacteria bacterium MarineAlpha9_Bin4]|tara:strand:- start:92 stop:562 length:471 start_codon:yes stop_codon:yes gene_type:complete
MRYLILIFLNFNCLYLNSADWKSSTFATVTITDEIVMPDGSIYKNFEQSGQGTSNLGKYSVSKCSGNRRDKNGKLQELTVYCEIELDDGNKFWTKVSRSSGESDVGVSKFIFLGGTKSFNKLKGKQCTYAVSYFKNKIFGNNKCVISDELFNELKK